MALARDVVAKGLNVRQTEALTKAKADSPKARAESRKELDKTADTLALERELGTLLGLKVEIHGSGDIGHLIIRYRTLEQLDDVLQRLSKSGRP